MKATPEMHIRRDPPRPWSRRLHLDPPVHRGHQRGQDRSRFPCRFLVALQPFPRPRRHGLFASYLKPSQSVSTRLGCTRTTPRPCDRHLFQPVKLLPVQLVQLGVDIFALLATFCTSSMVPLTLDGVLRAWDYDLYTIRMTPEYQIGILTCSLGDKGGVLVLWVVSSSGRKA